MTRHFPMPTLRVAACELFLSSPRSGSRPFALAVHGLGRPGRLIGLATGAAPISARILSRAAAFNRIEFATG
jgi:hypothetical protein